MGFVFFPLLFLYEEVFVLFRKLPVPIWNYWQLTQRGEGEEDAIVFERQGVALMLSFKKLSLVKSSMR